MKKHLFLISLCLALLAGLAQADDTRIRIIELKGRSAQEMIPLLQPMLGPGDAISGSGYQLILRTAPDNMARIEQAITQLDRAPRRLRISVHMGALSEAQRRGSDVRIDQTTEDLRIQAGSGHGTGGLSVEHSGSGGSAVIRSRSTETVRDADRRQAVQTLEGQPAYIASGLAFPYVDQLQYYGRQGEFAAGIDYRETRSGFYARALLRGDGQVVVDISPQREQLSNRGGGVVEQSALVTTLSGPLDTWLPLGGSGEQRQQSSSGYTRSHSTHTSRAEELWLKVELLD